MSARLARGVLGALAIAFGFATLAEGGHVLFGGPEARAAAGDVVLFVVAFNFGAGFAYVLAGVGALLAKRWAPWLAAALAAGTLLIAGAFAAHVLSGGAFARRTPVALTVRSTFWIVQALALARLARLARRSPPAERPAS